MTSIEDFEKAYEEEIRKRGLKKISSYGVEAPTGKSIMRPPPFPLADCRACALIGWICEDDPDPCDAVIDECLKGEEWPDCYECERKGECVVENKPCCWECEHLFDCLDYFRESYGKDAERFIREEYGLTWGEFIEAVKMLRRGRVK
jgi:hypothetical protein